MTLEQLRALSRTLDTIPSGAAWPFVYATSGADGNPVLLVHHKRVQPDLIRDLLRWTGRAGLVQGLIVRAPDGVLLLDARGPSGWKDELRAFFGPLVPALADAD